MNLSEGDFSKCISIVVSPHIVDLKPLQTLFKSLLLLSKFVFVNYTHTEPHLQRNDWLKQIWIDIKWKSPVHPGLNHQANWFVCHVRLVSWYTFTVRQQQCSGWTIFEFLQPQWQQGTFSRMNVFTTWMSGCVGPQTWGDGSADRPPQSTWCVCVLLRYAGFTSQLENQTSASVNTILINNDDGSLN